MKKGSEVFVGIDTAKAHNAVAVAEAGRDGEVRYLGTFDNTPDAVVKLVRKLADRYKTLHFCYEAGPCKPLYLCRSKAHMFRLYSIP